MSIRTALVALAVLVFSSSAMAWWNPDWTSRKAITVNTTPAGVDIQSELHDVPVLLRLHGGNFPLFLNVKDGGADFRFVAGDDKTPLKYHVEKFDAAAQIALVWVKLPVLKPQANDNKFYLYFGNQAAPKADDAAATYDVDTTAVFHFGGQDGVVSDSTAYGAATSGAAVASTPTLGAVVPNPLSLLGMGGMLSGTDAITIADAPQLKVSADKGWSASLWVKFETLPPAGGYLLDRGQGAQRLSVKLVGDRMTASLGAATVTSATPIVAGQWLHVAVALGSGQIQLFVNGAVVGAAPVTISEMSGAIAIGAGIDGKGALAMQIDELKIYGNARSADFFAAQAATEGERNDKVVSYGADESADSAVAEGGAKTTSHFGVIIQNVFGRKEAIVEQSVIGVCVVMAAIAVMVMFLKAIYLSRARRATDKFLSAYRRQTAASDASLDGLVQGTRSFGDSPLFKIYQQGIEQVQARLTSTVGAAAGLTDKSLNAIKATLDATAVREQQRLNSLLVLLTIAISGGPFIGLLGTVVGVMVTFATIAETGDINIAAIAPGMAAALLATVAGLGVAIPALFGYNYLSVKAKELSADMQVFGDEFIAKVNEVHGA